MKIKDYAVLFGAVMFSNFAAGQVFEEDFEFSGNLTGHGYSAHSGTTNSLSTTDGLTYSGYSNSGIGNAVLIGNAGGEDVHRVFTEQNVNGTVLYVSFLVNVTEPGSSKTGDYFIHLGNSASPTSFTLFCARVFVRVVSDSVNFGLSNSTTALYGSTSFSKNTTYLLLVKYVINTDGNDTTSLWVFSSGVPASEELAGSPELIHNESAGQDIVDAVGIRQGSTTQPQAVLDGIRIATLWSSAPLTVELLSLVEVVKGRDVVLNWRTATETGNHGFEIERRRAGAVKPEGWERVGFVQGAGTSSFPRQYSFADQDIPPGRWAYRIKQIDFDGSYTYFNSNEVEIGVAPRELTLGSNYPNPFNPSTTIDFTLGQPGQATLQVYNMLGEEVARLFDEQAEAGRIYQVKFDGSKMPSGVYFYTLSQGNQRLLKKFVLMK